MKSQAMTPLFSHADIMILENVRTVLGTPITRLAMNSHNPIEFLEVVFKNHQQPGYLLDFIASQTAPDSLGRNRKMLQHDSNVYHVIRLLATSNGGNLRRGVSRRCIAQELDISLSDKRLDAAIHGASRLMERIFDVKVKSYKGHLKVVTIDELQRDQPRVLKNIKGQIASFERNQLYFQGHKPVTKQIENLQVRLYEVQQEALYVN